MSNYNPTGAWIDAKTVRDGMLQRISKRQAKIDQDEADGIAHFMRKRKFFSGRLLTADEARKAYYSQEAVQYGWVDRYIPWQWTELLSAADTVLNKNGEGAEMFLCSADLRMLP